MGCGGSKQTSTAEEPVSRPIVRSNDIKVVGSGLVSNTKNPVSTLGSTTAQGSSATKQANVELKVEVAKQNNEPAPVNGSPVVNKPPKAARPKDSNQLLSQASSLLVKKTFNDDYTLGKQIGKGNYSVVHEAFDKRTNERVAVKITDKTDLDEDDIREIKEEVSILFELDHPNIIRIYGFYETSEKFLIVTEMMAGGELFDEIMEREFYFERDAQEVVKMIAEALSYMHGKGIVHRDLKPENILLTSKEKDAKVKIADFGFAVRTDVAIKEYQLKTACGTPAYVAPEIVAGLKYGREVDMWSLGVITFILLAGYPPFHHDDQQDLFRLIRKGKYSFDPTYWDIISEDAKGAVKAMLMVDRKKRATADDILKLDWIKEIEPPEPGGFYNGGVGGRGMGSVGRSTVGSINISPALKELKKFQARKRWKDEMAMALAKEGQYFSINAGSVLTLFPMMEEGEEENDITKLAGLGQSTVLTRLQQEKQKRAAEQAQNGFVAAEFLNT